MEGVLTYDESEYGFSFSANSGESLSERLGSKGVTSVLIDTLQLEVDIESREILYAWGYFPNIRGAVSKLNVPQIAVGRVRISSDYPFEPGVSYEVPGDRWRVSCDPSSGWIAIEQGDVTGAEFVQIASGTVLGIDNGDLVSIWLSPVFAE
ncbi:hypothetical protein ACWDY4_18725 [Streptomyces olivaceoviridis]